MHRNEFEGLTCVCISVKCGELKFLKSNDSLEANVALNVLTIKQSLTTLDAHIHNTMKVLARFLGIILVMLLYPNGINFNYYKSLNEI